MINRSQKLWTPSTKTLRRQKSGFPRSSRPFLAHLRGETRPLALARGRGSLYEPFSSDALWHRPAITQRWAGADRTLDGGCLACHQWTLYVLFRFILYIYHILKYILYYILSVFRVRAEERSGSSPILVDDRQLTGWSDPILETLCGSRWKFDAQTPA